MKLSLGFTTKGAALQVLRLYGYDYMGSQDYDKMMEHRRTQVSEPSAQEYRIGDAGLNFVLGVSPKLNFMQYWHGAEDKIVVLLAKIMYQCKNPAALCVIESMNGSVSTNVQAAMAVLAVATLKGGDRVAPMLLDMLKDGELS